MIFLLWPTARPECFRRTHGFWLDRAVDRSLVRTVVAVDTVAERELLVGFDVVVTYGSEPGVAWPSYCLSSGVVGGVGDVIVLASDDFFAPVGWDVWVREQFVGFDGCLVVDDGYQYGGCVTLPIMSFGCLVRLNYVIYHPSYRHLYSDAELWDNLSELGLLRVLRGGGYPLFEHRHWANGKRGFDGVDVRVSGVGGFDSLNYERRRLLPLVERLRV